MNNEAIIRFENAKFDDMNVNFDLDERDVSLTDALRNIERQRPQLVSREIQNSNTESRPDNVISMIRQERSSIEFLIHNISNVNTRIN